MPLTYTFVNIKAAIIAATTLKQQELQIYFFDVCWVGKRLLVPLAAQM